MIGFLRLKEVDNYGLDDPRRTELHKQIILGKPFLKKLYTLWYNQLAAFIPANAEKVVELGSGGGFLKDVVGNVITSDVLPLEGNDMVVDGLNMPFANDEVDAFIMVDVFHHVPDSKRFLEEMNRCLKPGGRIIMSEPCNSAWGRFIYTRFHHETFNPEGDWTIPGTGPMSDANGALPYIVFERDKDVFTRHFPELQILVNQKHTPLRYLLSGGVSMKSLVPSFSFGFFTFAEKILSPFSGWFSMFQRIVIEKKK